MEAVAAEVLSAIPLDGPAADGMPPLRISDPAAEAPWPSARKGLARDRPAQRSTPPDRSNRSNGFERSARGASVPLEEPADSDRAFRGALELADSRDASGGAPELADSTYGPGKVADFVNEAAVGTPDQIDRMTS
jgi:hypothetical protein